MHTSHDQPARLAHPSRRRFRSYSIAGIAGLTMLAGQCAPQQCAPAPPPAPAPAPSAVQQVVDLTNQRRAERGLPALAVNQALTNAAQAHSADQAARDRMGHDGSDGSNARTRIEREGYRWSAWGENVAMGYANATAVMDGWMGSAGHRRQHPQRQLHPDRRRPGLRRQRHPVLDPGLRPAGLTPAF